MSGLRPVAVAAVAAAIGIAGCGGGDGEPESPAAGEAGAGAGRQLDIEVELRRLGEFRSPLFIAQPPGMPELLFVVEKRGVIRVLRRDERLGRPFLDLRARVRHAGTEQGLLSIAFPPNYRRSGRFYVSYTDQPSGHLRIDEYRRSAKRETRARAGTRRPVMVIRQPAEIHNGGMLVFGPDRRLYVGAGDGGPSHDPDNRGQNKQILLGKILRIEPRRKGPGKPYGIPRGNPFRGRARAEIFAYGLRNPWRFSFDPKTDAMLIADVGQDLIEEINFLRPKRARGANYGWSGYEGTREFKPSRKRSNAVPPLHEYTHANRCSVTGGHVVRTSTLPSLRGRYVYGDYCDGEIRALYPPGQNPKGSNAAGSGGKDDARIGLEVPALVSFGSDDRGRIYAVSLNGPVYRLVER